MSKSLIDWGAVVAACLAIIGWAQTVAKFSSRMQRAEEDVKSLQSKLERRAEKADVIADVGELSAQIAKLTERLEAMDSKRESARGEIGEFRERISRELGEIRAALLGPGPVVYHQLRTKTKDDARD
ncbi:MAG: hypothetical protein ACLFQQ_21790 [Desulfococcaceae bacterium]